MLDLFSKLQNEAHGTDLAQTLTVFRALDHNVITHDDIHDAALRSASAAAEGTKSNTQAKGKKSSPPPPPPPPPPCTRGWRGQRKVVQGGKRVGRRGMRGRRRW